LIQNKGWKPLTSKLGADAPSIKGLPAYQPEGLKQKTYYQKQIVTPLQGVGIWMDIITGDVAPGYVV
jgi:hypothetical protein